jgi:hypothetical protein
MTDAPPELPPPDTELVEVDLDEARLAELRRRAADEGVAPEDDDRLLRYLVYLGAAYLRAERLGADALAAVRSQADAAKQAGSSLRFRYSEATRADGTARRAIVAEEHFLGAYGNALASMEAEVEARAERVRALEEALHGG